MDDSTDNIPTQRVLYNEEEASLNDPSQQKQKRRTPQQELDEKKEKMKKVLKWLRVKAEAVAWVLGSAYLIYSSNFFKVLYHNERINELFLALFLISICLNVCIAVYVTVIYPYILKIKEPWEKHSPRLLYMGTISGLLCFFSLIIAVWPVFGFKAPLMIFVFLMGYINSAHFLPNNQVGSLLFGGLFIATFFSHLIIDHDGFLH